MLIAELLDRSTGENQHTYLLSFSHQRHAHKSACFSKSRTLNVSELRIGLNVLDLYRAPLDYYPTNYTPSVDGHGMAVNVVPELGRQPVTRYAVINVALWEGD